MPDSAALILVIDDNPQNLQLIAVILGEIPTYDLSFASNGADALDAITEITPDLILLDVNMPGIDGLEVCRRIRSNEAVIFR